MVSLPARRAKEGCELYFSSEGTEIAERILSLNSHTSLAGSEHALTDTEQPWEWARRNVEP
jgi:hypothetical protein